jgi:hypothetical protein
MMPVRTAVRSGLIVKFPGEHTLAADRQDAASLRRRRGDCTRRDACMPRYAPELAAGAVYPGRVAAGGGQSINSG